MPTARFKITSYLSMLFLVMALADNKEDAHDIILKWWDSMSIKKPVKCTTSPEYLKEFHSAAQPFLSKEKYGRPLIRTGTCEPNKGSKYKFKVIQGGRPSLIPS